MYGYIDVWKQPQKRQRLNNEIPYQVQDNSETTIYNKKNGRVN